MSRTSGTLRGDDHGIARWVPTASWALPPASIAMAVRAPSEASSDACSATVSPGLPWGGALHGHQQEGAIRRLAHGRARRPAAELRAGEALAGGGNGLPVAHEQRSAAQGRGRAGGQGGEAGGEVHPAAEGELRHERRADAAHPR